jgi:hypothetical protein
MYCAKVLAQHKGHKRKGETQKHICPTSPFVIELDQYQHSTEWIRKYTLYEMAGVKNQKMPSPTV